MHTSLMVATPRKLAALVVDRFRHYSGGDAPKPLADPPWYSALREVGGVAHRVLTMLDTTPDPNQKVYRYVVMDLLDVLASLRMVDKSPLSDYSDFTGAFDDHARLSWDAFGRSLLSDDRLQWRKISLWARSVYVEQGLPPQDDAIRMGLWVWDHPPQSIIGPSPVTWDMALPRLMAMRFSRVAWHAAMSSTDGALLRELARSSCSSQTIPHIAMGVYWKRLRHHGSRYISHLMDQTDPSIDRTVIAARFAWFQTLLYYVLIRGKLSRLSAALETPLHHDLDRALATLIDLFM